MNPALLNLLSLAVTATALAAQTAYVYPRWREKENARRALGIGTVLIISLPVAILGYLDLETWLYFVVAFAVAGSVVVIRSDWNRRRHVAALKPELINNLRSLSTDIKLDVQEFGINDKSNRIQK